MDRNGKLLAPLSLREERGIEIRPLDRPILSRQQARVSYADCASTGELRGRYATDPRVDNERLVEIDYVFDRWSLREAVGATAELDFVIASHFLQLVPDAIGFLRDVTSVLKPDGLLCLALPDQRYTCDYFRRATGLADLVDAHLRGSRRPSIAQAYDHFAHRFTFPLEGAWNGTLHRHDLRRRHSPAEALRLARLATSSPQRFECRCHTFTPSSFCELLRGCRELELLELELLELWTTAPGEDDFVVILRSTGRERNGAPKVGAGRAPLPAADTGPGEPQPASGRDEHDFLAASATGGFDRRVFLIRGGLRYWITSSDWAVSAGFSWPQDIRWLADEELASYPLVSGPPAPLPAGTTAPPSRAP